MLKGLLNEAIMKELMTTGATVVGFADVGEVLGPEIAHLRKAISIGVNKNLNDDTVKLLLALQKKAARCLRRDGHRYLCIPPDSDRIRGTFISRLYPLFTHKIAATSAGLGWIGRNGLLISPEYGPRLSLATVLTDAPLSTGSPIKFSLCGECKLCVEYCPSSAITGKDWSRDAPYVELVRTDHCSSYKKNTRAVNRKPNCGVCINICPYGRKGSMSGVLSLTA